MITISWWVGVLLTFLGAHDQWGGNVAACIVGTQFVGYSLVAMATRNRPIERPTPQRAYPHIIDL